MNSGWTWSNSSKKWKMLKPRCNMGNIWKSLQWVWHIKVPTGLPKGQSPRWKKWCNRSRLDMRMPKHLNSFPGRKKVGDHRWLVGKDNSRVRRKLRMWYAKCPTWKPCSRTKRATMVKTQLGNQNQICSLGPNLSPPYLRTPFQKGILKSRKLFSNLMIIDPRPKMAVASVPEPSPT